MEGGTEPFAVGDILFIEVEAEAHNFLGEAGGEEAGAEVIAGVAGAAEEGFFLSDATPLGGEEIEPEVVGVVVELVAELGEGAKIIVEDAAAGDGA